MGKNAKKISKNHTLFKKIMLIVSVAILLVTVVLSATNAAVRRKQQIDMRLSELTEEAREIAYLSAQNDIDMFSFFTGRESTVRRYIQWKAGTVYEKYGGIIFVADKSGRIMSNIVSEMSLDPDFAASVSGNELRDGLVKVLSGEEIRVKTMVNGAPTFTVGVPYIQNNTVLGAVLIQTRAQHIEGSIWETILPSVFMAIGIAAVASLGIYMLLRMALSPLSRLTKAAERMADGDFSVKPYETEKDNPTTPEVEALTAAFNKMIDKLAQVESSRKEFVANVSHELRSPITSISGYIQGMTDGTIPESEHRKYMEIVRDETARLTKLIGDLLALSRLEKDDLKLNIESFDINEMLRRVAIRRMNDIEAKGIELSCSFGIDPCSVSGDRDRIEQVVVNLIDNAIKFTPEKGKIFLKTAVTAEGKVCRVTVCDNGIGILPEDKDKIFDRFFTCDRAHTSGKGTGLGLSICQRICEMHGQSIHLDDTDDGTTSFTFTLDKTAEKEGKTK